MADGRFFILLLIFPVKLQDEDKEQDKDEYDHVSRPTSSAPCSGERSYGELRPWASAPHSAHVFEQDRWYEVITLLSRPLRLSSQCSVAHRRGAVNDSARKD